MPYINVVQAYSERNRFQYNHKAIFAQVRKAMKKTGDNREKALKEIITKSFRSDIKNYEQMRKMFPVDVDIENPSRDYYTRKALEETMERLATPSQFLEQYVHIVSAMAKDIDKSYKPPFMLGISKEEAKGLVSEQHNSFTLRDNDIYIFKKEIKDLKFFPLPETRDINNRLPKSYSEASDYAREHIKSGYIRKEYLKQELKSKNFFWKFIYSKDVKAMTEYINKTENDLKAIGFTEENGREVELEFSKSFSTEEEINDSLNSLENEFEKEERRIQAEYTLGKEKSLNDAYGIKEEPSPEKLPQGKRMIDKRLLKVGFVPSLKSLDSDHEELQKIEEYLYSGRQAESGATVKLGDGTEIDSLQYETLKIAVEHNLNKLQQIKELPEHERKEHIKEQLNDTYGYYTEAQKRDIKEVLGTLPMEKRAEYESFVENEQKGMRYGAWSNMNERAMEEIASIQNERGIKENGYTVPNLFLPDEKIGRESVDLGHLRENFIDGEKSPRVESRTLSKINNLEK